MFTGEGGTADKDIILRQHQENAGKTKKGLTRIFYAHTRTTVQNKIIQELCEIIQACSKENKIV